VTRRYLLDTNIIGSKAFGGTRSLPGGQHLSCIVYAELMTAADPKEYRAYAETWKRAAEDDELIVPKLIVPQPNDWLTAARILHLLAQERKKNAGGKSPARTAAAKQELFADVLIAVSATRVGVIVVTDDGDFRAIKRFHKKLQIIGGGEFFA
jgi:predicted nucleic acid-binding protein